MQANIIMYILRNIKSSRHSYPIPANMSHIYSLLIISLVVVAVSTAAVADTNLIHHLNQMKALDLFSKQLPIDDQTKIVRVEGASGDIKPGSHVSAKLLSNFDLNKISWAGSGNMEDHCTAIIVDLDRKLKDSNMTTIYNQYLSFNIPDNKVFQGQPIATFEPPVVQCIPNSKHRLLVIIFLQKQYVDLPEVASYSSSSGRNSERRLNFDLKNILNRYAKKIVALNTFYVEADSSGTCNASTPTKLSPILFLMVIASFAFSCSRKYH